MGFKGSRFSCRGATFGLGSNVAPRQGRQLLHLFSKTIIRHVTNILQSGPAAITLRLLKTAGQQVVARLKSLSVTDIFSSSSMYISRRLSIYIFCAAAFLDCHSEMRPNAGG